MITFIAVSCFVLGLIIGSFLNVVILRLNTGKSLFGRSKCPNCQAKIKVYDLIPILSYWWLGGKCRHCHSSISKQYFFVETVTGILYLVGVFFSFNLFGFFSPTFFLFYAIAMALLVVIFVYDLKHKIIPNQAVFALIVLGLIGQFVSFPAVDLSLAGLPHGPLFLVPDLLTLLAGPILFTPFALIWFFSRGRLMGFGDAKLAWAIGWLVGIWLGISAIIVAFWIGALLSILAMAIGYIFRAKVRGRFKSFGMKTEVPFAPFLVISLFLVWLLNLSFLNIIHW